MFECLAAAHASRETTPLAQRLLLATCGARPVVRPLVIGTTAQE